MFVILPALLVAGCGGGSGDRGTLASSGPTGALSGYIYVPVGAAKVKSGARRIVSLDRSAAVPAGYTILVGATVTCGGRSTTTDVTGYFSLTGVSDGNQTVTVSKTGYQAFTISVSITANTSVDLNETVTVVVSLTPQSAGSIHVTSTPSGAEIYVDGTDTSLTTPATVPNVTTGSHSVYVTKTGYDAPTPETTTVTDGETSNVAFTLSPAASAATVAASVSASSGDTDTTFNLSCDVTGTRNLLEGRCDTSGLWYEITSPGTSLECKYQDAGSYIPGCRVNGNAIGNADAPITVEAVAAPTVAASMSPATGTISTEFTLTCDVTGNASQLEGRCDDSSEWSAISSGSTMACHYETTGTHTPGCRVNSVTSDNISIIVSKEAITTWVKEFGVVPQQYNSNLYNKLLMVDILLLEMMEALGVP